jgi:SPOR domain
MGGAMSLGALQDLFARHQARATGVWRLGSDPQRTIFFHEGGIVFAQSTHPLDRLTTLLVERGKITQAQLDYAMENLKPGLSIGKNLIDMGFITQRDLLEVARAQVERVVWGALANLEDIPSFEAKDLDSSVVRLSFDTPLILLSGLLNLRDRERMLETLGSLDQTVALADVQLQSLGLPADLAKIPGLIDGKRTLLALSREAGVEPMRLGAFALFLREMGWARLSGAEEIPLRIALPAAEMPLHKPHVTPEEPSRAQPPLFTAIEASQRPTENLDHMSEALDRLPQSETSTDFNHHPDEEELLSIKQPFSSTPSPFPQMDSDSRPHQGAEGSIQVPHSFESNPRSKSSKYIIYLALTLIAGAGAYLGFQWFKTRSHQSATSALPPIKQPETKLESPAQTLHEAPTPRPDLKTSVAPIPDPTPSGRETDAKTSMDNLSEERFHVLASGKLDQALEDGQRHKSKLASAHWSLRLVIACQENTVQHAAIILKDQKPDLFVIPIKMRDGKKCYQVFLGDYSAKAEAESAAEKLPAEFRAQGNRPKPFRISEIPEQQ